MNEVVHYLSESQHERSAYDKPSQIPERFYIRKTTFSGSRITSKVVSMPHTDFLLPLLDRGILLRVKVQYNSF